MGDKKKSTGGAKADRCTPTMGKQHKHNQTTDLWREIHDVHNRPTRATGEPNFGGKEEKGMDKRLPGWRNTNVPLGTNTIYLVRVVAGCVWALEERIWAREVFVVGEGIHFILDGLVRLMPTK